MQNGPFKVIYVYFNIAAAEGGDNFSYFIYCREVLYSISFTYIVYMYAYMYFVVNNLHL